MSNGLEELNIELGEYIRKVSKSNPILIENISSANSLSLMFLKACEAIVFSNEELNINNVKLLEDLPEERMLKTFEYVIRYFSEAYGGIYDELIQNAIKSGEIRLYYEDDEISIDAMEVARHRLSEVEFDIRELELSSKFSRTEEQDLKNTLQEFFFSLKADDAESFKEFIQSICDYSDEEINLYNKNHKLSDKPFEATKRNINALKMLMQLHGIQEQDFGEILLEFSIMLKKNNSKSLKKLIGHLKHPAAGQFGSKKSVNLPCLGNIEDGCKMVHEIRHYLNWTEDESDFVESVSSEGLSYFEELNYLDFLEGLYPGESINALRKKLINRAYKISKDFNWEASLITVYEKLGSVSKENVSMIFKNGKHDNFEDEFKRVGILKKLEGFSSYTFGIILALYMHFRLRENSEFISTIIQFNSDIKNNPESKTINDFVEFMKKIGLKLNEMPEIKNYIYDELNWVMSKDNVSNMKI